MHACYYWRHVKCFCMPFAKPSRTLPAKLAKRRASPVRLPPRLPPSFACARLDGCPLSGSQASLGARVPISLGTRQPQHMRWDRSADEMPRARGYRCYSRECVNRSGLVNSPDLPVSRCFSCTSEMPDGPAASMVLLRPAAMAANACIHSSERDRRAAATFLTPAVAPASRSVFLFGGD